MSQRSFKSKDIVADGRMTPQGGAAQNRSQQSLARRLSQRLAITALLAIALQIGITAIRSYLDEIDLGTNFVKYEARLIANEIKIGDEKKLSATVLLPARYRGAYKAAYSFRVLSSEGRVLLQHNGSLLATLSPWRYPLSETQDFWLRRIDARNWMHIAGGIRMTRGDEDIWVEVATLGDPAGAHFGIFARELLNDVWMPMIPFVVLTLGVAIVTVRKALEPLVHAANRAGTLAVLDRSERLDVASLPREAASLAAAINGLLDKVAELVQSQRLFIARAAHELRTPLSIMLLELERIDDVRVRRLETDVRSMSAMVDRLLTLARLESVEKPEVTAVDLGDVAGGLVSGMREWGQQTGHTIELHEDEPVVVRADRFAVREAMRNLIENAVKHSPTGTLVRVVIGPGPRFAVEDAGPGLAPDTTSTLLEPFARGKTASEGAGLGLAIVTEAAALTDASICIGRSSLGGAKVEMSFAHDDARAGVESSAASP